MWMCKMQSNSGSKFRLHLPSMNREQAIHIYFGDQSCIYSSSQTAFRRAVKVIRLFLASHGERTVMPDWGTNPVKGLFFAHFEYIRDSPTPRQSGITGNEQFTCILVMEAVSTALRIAIPDRELVFWLAVHFASMHKEQIIHIYFSGDSWI